MINSLNALLIPSLPCITATAAFILHKPQKVALYPLTCPKVPMFTTWPQWTKSRKHAVMVKSKNLFVIGVCWYFKSTADSWCSILTKRKRLQSVYSLFYTRKYHYATSCVCFTTYKFIYPLTTTGTHIIHINILVQLVRTSCSLITTFCCYSELRQSSLQSISPNPPSSFSQSFYCKIESGKQALSHYGEENPFSELRSVDRPTNQEKSYLSTEQRVKSRSVLNI